MFVRFPLSLDPFCHHERDRRYPLERRVMAAKAAITEAQREYQDAKETLRQHDIDAARESFSELLDEVTGDGRV